MQRVELCIPPCKYHAIKATQEAYAAHEILYDIPCNLFLLCHSQDAKVLERAHEGCMAESGWHMSLVDMSTFQNASLHSYFGSIY